MKAKEEKEKDSKEEGTANEEQIDKSHSVNTILDESKIT